MSQSANLMDVLPLVAVGVTFLALGLAKVYGLRRGIEGGGEKPLSQRVCGTCPSWSRQVNLAVIGMFLAIGLGSLAILAWLLLRPN